MALGWQALGERRPRVTLLTCPYVQRAGLLIKSARDRS